MTSGCAIHANALSHQREYAEALLEGFKVHGLKADIRDGEADIHVVIGPWFALKQWRYANTLYLDRGYWEDPNAVSVHWLRNGEKHFTHNTTPREHPEPKPLKTGNRRIYLCDYNAKPVGEFDSVRFHPANGQRGDLYEDLAKHDIAIGRRTTALVDAALEGLLVHTDDPHSPVWPISGRTEGRGEWLTGLAWHNWTKSEISRGLMWENLSQQ